jgi:glutathione S-transferase
MMPAEVSPDDDVVVYVMPGSQYSAKVLAALDSRNIAHHVIFVSIRAEQRKLPSGGKMVPECTVGEEVIVDSEVILRYFDEHFDTAFFPTPLAGELLRRASDGVLGGAVLYYNWVYGPSYTRSMRAQGQGNAPAILCCFKGMAIDFMTASHRQKFRLEAATKMGVGDADLEDEPEIYSMLVAELEFFQQHLDRGKYLVPGAAPTAADFSAYAMLERLVGQTGDADVLPSIPELLNEEKLERLWEWHRMMREEHPIRFKGKRLPAA